MFSRKLHTYHNIHTYIHIHSYRFDCKVYKLQHYMLVYRFNMCTTRIALLHYHSIYLWNATSRVVLYLLLYLVPLPWAINYVVRKAPRAQLAKDKQRVSCTGWGKKNSLARLSFFFSSSSSFSSFLLLCIFFLSCLQHREIHSYRSASLNLFTANCLLLYFFFFSR